MNMHHYNPDWLSDEELVTNFVARQADFGFLRDELAHMPLRGSVQHYLLVGLRGAGKTTLLKRLAVAIRQDEDIKDHLIALSFPEELYQVKNLSDFWWAACDALVDELDRQKQDADANRLEAQIERRKHDNDNPLADDGLQLLQESCDGLARRPVLLVDNLDFIFQRIDKKGRKLKDDNAPAYWALREALSTQRSPIVIGGSTRLSEPFTDYDKAFYDFFIPRRLGKLSLKEAQQVLEQLAKSRNLPQVEKQLTASVGRIETLHELTGGNPRALSFIFELLRQGPNSRALDDFIRLMDMTTPYYKARFEELSEQAQVVMHALAVRRSGNDGLRFGHTASEIGDYCGLPTNTVSTQLDVLGREGLVEKCADYGRMQYRIMEQLFRLWLQMRANRRIRQNVIGLAEFLEALFELDDLPAILQGANDVEALAHARFAFALAEMQDEESLRREMETDGADHVLQHLELQKWGDLQEYLPHGDLPEDLNAIVTLRYQLRKHPRSLSLPEQDALIGSIILSVEQKKGYVEQLCTLPDASTVVAEIRLLLQREQRMLFRNGFHEKDAAQLHNVRMRGYLPLPHIAPDDIPKVAKCGMSHSQLSALVWRLLGVREAVKFEAKTAKAWFDWGMKYARQSTASEWAGVAGNMRRSRQRETAKQVLNHAMTLGDSPRIHYEQAIWATHQKRYDEAETQFRAAIELDPADAESWYELAYLLRDKRQDFSTAEAAYRRAAELVPDNSDIWNSLGNLLQENLGRFDEAEAAYRRAREIAPDNAMIWRNSGILLSKLMRFDEAEAAYREALRLNPDYAKAWSSLGNLLASKLRRFDEAEHVYREALRLEPNYAKSWVGLGNLLANYLQRFDEAEAAYRQALGLEPDYLVTWNNLGNLLADKLQRIDEAEKTYREALVRDPAYGLIWLNLGRLLDKQQRLDEALQAYEKGKALQGELSPFWQQRYINLQIRPLIQSAQQALAAYDGAGLEQALSLLLTTPTDSASALVSTSFVEGFLASVLQDEGKSSLVLSAMQTLGYEKYARPLLLAFEAIMTHRHEMLAVLEPEIQTAAQQMLKRLTAGIKNHKKQMNAS